MNGMRRDLLVRLEALGIDESDLQELRSCSSGPGGQHVNKVETSIRIRHNKSGLEGYASEHRSLYLNRQLALTRLLDRIEAVRHIQKQERGKRRFLKRVSKRRRPKHLAEKILREKKLQSERKQLRRKVNI